MGICASKEEEKKPATRDAPAAAAAGGDATRAGNEKLSHAQHAANLVPATTFMFSGCQDEQTSADVGNTASFSLPADVGVGGAGGACTNALLSFIGEEDCEARHSFGTILTNMVGYLKQKGYTQRPMLSTSRSTGMDEKFTVCGDQKGTKYALLIGINYVGHSQGKLNGCVNDVRAMKKYLKSLGFKEENIRVLVDDQHGDFETKPGYPNKKEILREIDWLTETAKDGDVAFFHYSGHGTQVKDRDGDEEDGMDEALVPHDYKDAGLIVDDDLLSELVCPMPKGVRFTAVMDCCHSGSILDLPYSFKATPEGLAKIEQNPGHTTAENTSFMSKLQKYLKYVKPEHVDMVKKKFPQLAGPLDMFKKQFIK